MARHDAECVRLAPLEQRDACAVAAPAREARGRGMLVVVAAARVSGALSRTIELLPGRALLPLASRADHVAAGGESGDYVAAAPPGR